MGRHNEDHDCVARWDSHSDSSVVTSAGAGGIGVGGDRGRASPARKRAEACAGQACAARRKAHASATSCRTPCASAASRRTPRASAASRRTPRASAASRRTPRASAATSCRQDLTVLGLDGRFLSVPHGAFSTGVAHDDRRDSGSLLSFCLAQKASRFGD
jgi:hypothetical protein